uniref:SCAN box domain-containing protein n=1 Tax=Astyanax mexicanus TaxID=7994 RepID=A0A3B1ICL7_ASTMX
MVCLPGFNPQMIINPETYRQRFRKDGVLRGETPKELFTRLSGLYARWMRPEGKTKEEIGQTIVLEQFLNMINPELRSWIIERSPASPQQAIEMAEASIAARRAERDFHLGKPDSSRQKTLEKSCGAPPGLGHMLPVRTCLSERMAGNPLCKIKSVSISSDIGV